MIPTLEFGRTGHRSTRIIFGAAALGSVTQAEADTTMEFILEHGVNHIDTAASYGESELRIGPWMKEHRDTFFLATKTGDRTYQEAYDSIRRSLERLRVDHVDLIQLHNLVEPDEWDIAMGSGGALEAAIQARDEGLVRFIGVTGHGLRIAEMHSRSLERFDFDSVLLPYNFSQLQLPDYRDDVAALRETCAERNVAVQTIKSIARRRWSDPTAPHHSWYEPLTDGGAIGRAVRFVLSEPDLFLNTTSDASLLPLIFDSADGALDRPSDDELSADVNEFGVTALFDGDVLERI